MSLPLKSVGTKIEVIWSLPIVSGPILNARPGLIELYSKIETGRKTDMRSDSHLGVNTSEFTLFKLLPKSGNR